jgi:Uma2 family endonuclease
MLSCTDRTLGDFVEIERGILTMYQTAEQFALTMPDARVLMSDEPEMESSLHYLQLLLLVTCLDWYWRDKNDYFVGANLTIYFSRQQLKNHDFRGPDFFLVKNVSNHPRPSWVVWEEDGQYPNLIIELLSDSTAKSDRGIKKQLYQDRFRTPEYFWFSPDDLEFKGYRLAGHQYEEIPFTTSGKCWSEELELFLGIHNQQLRYFTADEMLVPTPKEAALQEKERADLEKQRVDQLVAQLRSLGVEPQL